MHTATHVPPQTYRQTPTFTCLSFLSLTHLHSRTPILFLAHKHSYAHTQPPRTHTRTQMSLVKSQKDKTNVQDWWG